MANERLGTSHSNPDQAPVPSLELSLREVERFPVVGIGASAGGLDAYSRLLKNLSPTTGMAFVLVQHLDPHHESHLTELLAKVTTMPVVEVQDQQSLEANHVYIIPHNRLLTIEQGVLHLAPRPEGKEAILAINLFFGSLAKDRHRLAIGVVLSGTGSDGTLGLQAIKAEGGITFAQDGTAPHESMPQSAVQSGCVDFVLPPEEIAQELSHISQHRCMLEKPDPGTGETSGSDPTEEAALATLFRLLLQASRTDFANYKRSTILRRIDRRLVVHHLDRLTDYVKFISEHPEELTDLQRDLLIHVTRFFRDPEVFDALTTTVFPALARDRHPEAPVRVWVAGCSTGEEAYSLAICLVEYFGEIATFQPIKLFATDVSEPALEKARAGKYPESIASEVSPERLQRFFVRTEGGYQINKAIRDICVFARHDMTRDPPFSNLDLISCRNVLIYLSPLLQKRVWPLFHYALRNQGFLLLGNSETVGTFTDQFRIVDAREKIYAAKVHQTRMPIDVSFKESPFGERPGSRNPPQELMSDQEIQREVERRLAARYAPAGVVINDDMEVLQFRGETGTFLAPAPGVASLNLLKMAREGLLLDLRAAIEESRKTGATSRREGLRVRANGHYIDVNVQVIPVILVKVRCFAVLFEEIREGTPLLGNVSPDKPKVEEQHDFRDGDIARVQQELVATKEYMQSIIEEHEASNEELRAANEETLSSNEELQSTNEELQTAKEELQATNEELSTVNEELQHRNRETAQLGDDLNNLLRSVNIPIVMVGHDLRVRRFTPSAANLFSLIPGDLGRPIADIKPKLVDVDLQGWIEQVLESLAVREVDVQDQNGRWLRLSIRPYRTQENRIDGAVVSVQDIEVFKRNETEFSRARQYAENILNGIRLPIVVLDGELRIVSANLPFFEFFGLASTEAPGRSLAEIGSRCLDQPTLLQQLRQSYDHEQEFGDLKLELNVAPANSRTVLVNGRRLVLPGQETPLLLVCLEEITERSRMENQLRESQKMDAIGRLAAGVAHDFNNTLTVIELCTELLGNYVELQPKALELVQEISTAGKRAAKLTQQLLAFSRTQIVVPKPLNLNNLLANIRSMLRHILGERIRLSTIPAPDLGVVNADTNLIEQAILNLSMNARDAMPQGGELTLVTQNVEVDELLQLMHPECQVGPYICVTVRDTGCGMDQKTLTRIFEPFFTTKEFGSGFGLGLASVYGSIKQSGGFIEVRSQPGKGTEFAIYLPRAPDGTEVKHPSTTRIPVTGGTETILLVEDASDVRSLVSLILSQAGYKILKAGDGAEALDIASRHDGVIDVLVTDIVMPKMDGLQLADRLVAVRPNLKVLFVSGHAASAAVEAVMPRMHARFLQKPFSSGTLAQNLRSLLDTPHG